MTEQNDYLREQTDQGQERISRGQDSEIETAARPGEPVLALAEEEQQPDQAQPGPGRTQPEVTGRPTVGEAFSKVTLGGALIALDTLSDRLEQAQTAQLDQELGQRSPDDVLIPISEWAERFDLPEKQTARYLMLGMMVDARNRARRGSRLLRSMGDLFAGGINKLLAPFNRSPIFRPARKGYDKALTRGESQVQRWIELGRQEERSSRSLAQTAINRIADDAMDDLVDNPRVQKFIQEIVQAQSKGFIDEAIEELRERTISTDYFIERPVRQLLRRPAREAIPPPDFRPELIRPTRLRHLPLRKDTLMGNYAGFMSRLVSFVLDIATLSILLAILSWLYSATVNILNLDRIADSILGNGTAISTIFPALVTLSGAIIVVGYLVVFWVLTGQTLGMMIMGLRLVNQAGAPLTFWQAILRLIGFSISVAVFLIGFVWVIGSDRRLTWQDKLARTYVVYAWDARPDESFLFDYLSRQV